MNLYKKDINGKNIQIADYPGEKGPIIAIHGLTGTHKNMHYYGEMLKGEYRFISLDLRGRGNSDEADENTTMFSHAEDVLTFIKESGFRNPILLGHSMGAYISAIVASRLSTVKAVILLDGGAQVSKRQDNIVKPSLGRLSKKYSSREKYVEEIKDLYSRLGISWSENLKEAVEYEVKEVGDHFENASTENRILSDWNSFKSFNPKEVFSKIKCPILLVYAEGYIGKMEPLFFLEEYEDAIAYGENIRVIFSKSNHYTMVFENREDINEPIVKFLSNI